MDIEFDRKNKQTVGKPKYDKTNKDQIIAFVMKQGEKFLSESNDPDYDLRQAENECGYIYF